MNKVIFDGAPEDPNYNPLPEERPGGFEWGAGGDNERANHIPGEGERGEEHQRHNQDGINEDQDNLRNRNQHQQ